MADNSDAERRSRERLEAIRKAKREGTLGSDRSSSSRSSTTSRPDARQVPTGKGLLQRARDALVGRGDQIDSIVDHATRAGDARQGRREE